MSARHRCHRHRRQLPRRHRRRPCAAARPPSVCGRRHPRADGQAVSARARGREAALRGGEAPLHAGWHALFHKTRSPLPSAGRPRRRRSAAAAQPGGRRRFLGRASSPVRAARRVCGPPRQTKHLLPPAPCRRCTYARGSSLGSMMFGASSTDLAPWPMRPRSEKGGPLLL